MACFIEWNAFKNVISPKNATAADRQSKVFASFYSLKFFLKETICDFNKKIVQVLLTKMEFVWLKCHQITMETIKRKNK